MVRIVKEPALRRNEILDSAQRLVYSKGFEQMTIQDILDDRHISKGAFYHYFDSKPALLDALLDRMKQEAEQVVMPIFHDPGRNALEKLQDMFDTAGRWKTTRKTYVLALLRGWYSDDNAIVRQKQMVFLTQWMAPLLTEVIQQGVREGLMETPFPDQMGEVALGMIQSLSDTMTRLILACEPGCADMQQVNRLIAAYTYVMERALGIPPGSVKLVDPDVIKEWFVTADAT
jgi:AcrR family transcriptional regulator